jgi:hypothetical protein
LAFAIATLAGGVWSDSLSGGMLSGPGHGLSLANILYGPITARFDSIAFAVNGLQFL